MNFALSPALVLLNLRGDDSPGDHDSAMRFKKEVASLIAARERERYTARNRAIYAARFLNGLTYRELGERFGLSIERSRQIDHKIKLLMKMSQRRLWLRRRAARPIEFPEDRRDEWLEFRPGDPL